MAKSQNSELTLEDAVLQFEQDLIRGALQECRGRVSHAAKLLSVTHQGLAYIINARQKKLLEVRTPIIKRRRIITTRPQLPKK